MIDYVKLTTCVFLLVIQIVDYDPLHFIRCHARDNDPLDCETKVWRCAFEPSVNDPYHETSTVVATCGGECVCLIDCRSGRVMKRFKHFGEVSVPHSQLWGRLLFRWTLCS